MEVTPEIVRELLSYDPATGILAWKPRDLSWFKSEQAFRRWNTRYAGKRAGGLYQKVGKGFRYRSIRVLGTRFLEHRVVWMIMTGQPAPEQIDHINRYGTDNRWENLRAVTNKENSRNSSMHTNNTSGYAGVTWNKKNGKWQSQGREGKRTVYLGLFDSKEDAAKAAQDFRLSNGYSQDHGADLAHYYRKAS